VTYYDLERIWYMETTLASTNLGMAELTQPALGRRDGSGQEHAVPVEGAGGSAMSSGAMRGGRDAAN
jgi:hypothetical protein